MNPYEDAATAYELEPALIESDLVGRGDLPGASGILARIEEALARPDSPPQEWERLMATRAALRREIADQQFMSDRLRLAEQLPRVRETGQVRDSAGKVVATYASWEDIRSAIAPSLAANGFILSFSSRSAEGLFVVVASLRHRSGRVETASASFPAIDTEDLRGYHAVTAAISFAQRNATRLLLGLSFEPNEKRPDPAPKRRRKSAAQAKRDGDFELLSLEIEACQSERLLNIWHANIDSRLANLPRSWFDPVVDLIERRRNELRDAASVADWSGQWQSTELNGRAEHRASN